MTDRALYQSPDAGAVKSWACRCALLSRSKMALLRLVNSIWDRSNAAQRFGAILASTLRSAAVSARLAFDVSLQKFNR